MDVERLLEDSAWVQSLAARLVSDPNEADDLIQETWVAALRRPPREQSGHRSWLRRVLRNFAYLSFRSRLRRLERERLAASPEVVSDPQAAIEKAELTRRLADKVLALDEPSRTVIILRYFDGLTGSEIAARLGIQPGAARMRLKRALDELRRELGDDHGSPEAWRGLLLVPLVAAGRPPATCAGAHLDPPVPVRFSSLIAKAAVVLACLGAGGLVGSRLGEGPAAPGVSTVMTAALEDRDSRIHELEEQLAETRSELEKGAAWRLDLEERLRATEEAVAQLSIQPSAYENRTANPA
jgi:RNA polymerase sigma-70 factor (ECF subfamily)